jgi:hypothetical protein
MRMVAIALVPLVAAVLAPARTTGYDAFRRHWQARLTLGRGRNRRLSLDPTHCSVMALMRHVTTERVGEKRTDVTMSVEPDTPPDQLLSTILRLCRALMGVAAGANELLGFTTASGQLSSLVLEFEKNGWPTTD